ncbi:CCNT [Lepeophtheirus salmonis]|uniref:CCNT n=1 Tax=Lepeophtheirus salmonis TaxID=72036 RepID=A0A7R8CAZ8_LEPSM|nr:CCNT [Lepeophtheirus salmonis]CAF2756108.1 CCNT [Lepeophtheirus salmonis]
MNIVNRASSNACAAGTVSSGAHTSSSGSSSAPAPPNMNMMTTTGQGRWYFSAESLHMTPSRRHNITSEKELGYRQQAANFIQDMGQRLHVPQLCINTAIVYMQRFYMFHSFTRFHRNTIAAAALFLAAKVEEQPRKLEHVIKVAHICLHREQPPLDTRSEQYIEQAQELVTNENILLQTLGFDVAIDHPHTHVVRCCQLVKASKDLAQTSYFMATNSLHLTTMCLRHTPTIVACVCIHLACKWTNYKIPLSSRGKEWFLYVDPNTSLELLNKLTDEFLTIFDRCPSRLKKKIMATAQATKEEEERRASNDIPASHYTPDYSRRQELPSSSSKHPSIPMGKSSGQSSQQPSTRSSSGHHGSRNEKPHHYPPHRSNVALPGQPQTDKPSKPNDPSRATYDEYKKQKQQQQSNQGQSSRLSSSAPGQHRHMSATRPSQPGVPPPSHQQPVTSQRPTSASQNMPHQQKHHKHNGPPPPQQQQAVQSTSTSLSTTADPNRHHKTPLPPPPPQQQQQPPPPQHARHHSGYPSGSSQHQIQKSERKQTIPSQQPKNSNKSLHSTRLLLYPLQTHQHFPNPTSGNGLLNIIKEKSVSPNKRQRLDKTASLFSPPSSTSSSIAPPHLNQRNRSLSNCSQSSNEEMSVNNDSSVQKPPDPLKISLKPSQSSETKKRHRASSEVRSTSPSVKIARVVGSNQDLDLFSPSSEIKKLDDSVKCTSEVKTISVEIVGPTGSCEISPLPEPRQSLSVVRVGNSVFACGGFYIYERTECFEYIPEIQRWLMGPRLGKALIFSGAVSFQNRLVLIGGRRFNYGTGSWDYLKDIQVWGL